MDTRLKVLQEGQSKWRKKESIRQEVGEKLEGLWKGRKHAGERSPVTAEYDLENRGNESGLLEVCKALGSHGGWGVLFQFSTA